MDELARALYARHAVEPAPVTVDDGSALPFEALWRCAKTEDHKAFLRDLLALEE
jgi:hypothetical protein